MNEYNRIHTSDRNLFKQCRRKWDYQSPLRQNLQMKDAFNSYFWFGTGFHFALEDYHGYNRFGSPITAFQAYYDCFEPEQLTMDCEALATMAPGMFAHYVDDWLPKRKPFKTLWVDGKPQVEVEVIFELKALTKEMGRPIYYSMKFDRVVTDELGRIWILDYKTAARFDTEKLETDPQISVYSWGAEIYYQKPIEGMLYLQFKKALIKEPKILKRPEGALSIDKKQNTNYYKYLQALEFRYGCLADVPPENLETLEHFRLQESELGDEFIRYDLVRRNKISKRKQYDYILQESRDMLNKDLPLYPNPSINCYRQCNFRSACLAEEDGLDSKFIIDNNYEQRKGEDKEWKNKIVWPKQSQKTSQMAQ